MFFLREKPRQYSFNDRLEALRAAGFETKPAPGGGVRVSRGGCAAEITQEPSVRKLGVAVGEEIATLVDLGYQKELWTHGGRRLPARAEHLKELHAFQVDLYELLGLGSLYNQSLGTVNDAHLYDRVEGRER